MSSVFVRYSGRRERIRLNSENTAVHVILREACSRFGVEVFGMGLRSSRVRRGPCLDATLAWAHTGLPNNCEVELVQAHATRRGVVRVACSFEGETVEAVVPSHSSLADAVVSSIGQVPLCVRILRDRFQGDALRQSLDSLGYGANSSVKLNVEVSAVPLSVKSSCQAANQPNLNQLEVLPKPKPPTEEIADDTLVTVASNKNTAPEAEAEARSMVAQRENKANAIIAAGEMLKDANSESLALLRKYVSGASRHRKIQAGNKNFASLCRVKGALELLGAIGYECKGDMYEMRHDGPYCISAALQAIPSMFNPYKTLRVDMRGDAMPSGASTIERELMELRNKERAIVTSAKPDRRVVLSRPCRRNAPQNETVADEQPSDDSLLRHVALQRAASSKNEAELTTRAVRELRELRKKRVYATLLLKFVFPDGLVMTATFGASESVADAQELLREYCTKPFVLIFPPPRRELAPADPLHHFAPAALITVKTELPYLNGHVRMSNPRQPDIVPQSIPILDRTFHKDEDEANQDRTIAKQRTNEANSASRSKSKQFSWLKTG